MKLDTEALRKRCALQAEKFPGGTSWQLVELIDEIHRLRKASSEIEAMIDKEIERLRKDDLRKPEWWEPLRKHWLDGIGCARAVSEREMWRIKSAIIDGRGRE